MNAPTTARERASGADPMSRPSISPVWAAALPAAAAVAALLRWMAQGTGNLYSKANLRLYVPDPVLGWRRLDRGVPWIGLDAIALIAGIAVAVAAGAWLLQRREARTGTRHGRLRVGLWTAAALPWLVPLWALAAGTGPGDAREARPSSAVQLATDGIDARLEGAPAGRYVVVPHPEAAIAARLEAGGESFEARFAGDLEGSWVADPTDLTQPMRARVTVAAASVDTGIALRSQHAREDLQVEEHPRIAFELTGLDAAEQRNADEIAFSARGRIELVGREHDATVRGTVRRLGASARQQLGVEGDAPTLLVQASLPLDVSTTAIGNDGTFDTNDVPIQITLILRHASETK